MPIYKGSNEVTSGNLRKGSTNIENGYKETSPFYTNTNGITINFVDAISGATMDTTQFSSVGVPGASFSSFSRTITVDSGRIFSTNPTVSESGDSGNNVTTSISSQTSTSAVLNVSGTYPTSGTTVTLTVNGATQVQLPNLVVTQNGNYPLTTTGDGGALGIYNWSVSNSSGCVGGTSGSGTADAGSSSSNTYYSYSRPNLAGGPYGNGCGVTCSSSFSSSKSGYNSGSTTFTQTGTYPVSSYTCSLSAPSGYNSPIYATTYLTASSCTNNNPATTSVSGPISFSVTASLGGVGCNNGGYASTYCGSGTVSCPSVPRDGTSTSGTVGGTPYARDKTFIDIPSATESGATLTSNLGSKAICYDGTVTFSGTANGDFSTWGGSVGVALNCTGQNSGATGTLGRSEGTSGLGTNWSDVDYGTDCDANNSWLANETITCTRTLTVFVSGVGSKVFNLSSVSVVMN